VGWDNVIHQFAELGRYYQEREGVSQDAIGRLAQFAGDPAAKFRTTKVLLLVFSEAGFDHAEIDEYDESKRLKYLYRAGPPNGWDATPTTGLTTVKKDESGSFDFNFEDTLRKKIARLGKSVEDARIRNETVSSWEKDALDASVRFLQYAANPSNARLPGATWNRVLTAIKERHQPASKEAAILSVGWLDDSGIKNVGDFVSFQNAITQSGESAASQKKGVGDVKGVGQCCICGEQKVEVSGLLQIPNFKVYTLDKPGSISGGFEASAAWKNFPACRVCCERVDFAGERVKKNLTFDYYSSFKYLFLPLPVRPEPTFAYELLERLITARVNKSAAKRLTQAEDELFYVVAEQENNRLQVDLLFYQPDPQSFRPALYISGLLPSRFRELFAAKERVDAHLWLNAPSTTAFTKEQFTFGSFNNVFPHAHGGSKFDDEFLAATRAALELQPLRLERMLQSGMRWVRQDYRDGKAWQYRLADLFRSILFFDELLGLQDRSVLPMTIDFGTSPQASRVRSVLEQANGKLKNDPAAQAAFLVGACCSRIEAIQQRSRGSSPFEGKLKGFRLNQADVQGLFVAAKDKAKAYGEEKFANLLECAAMALAASPEQWPLSPDEVSYFFALGHALRPRFASDTDATDGQTPK
jgi:CRISPR-associated protein Csh1